MSVRDDIYAKAVSLIGMVTPERSLEMADYILDHRPEMIVEIGVFGGKSLIPMAMACRHNDHGHVYGIDPWRVDAALEGENEANQKWWSQNVDLEDMHRKTMKAIWDHHLDPWVTIVRAQSHTVGRLFHQIDLLNLDGNHSEIASCRDVEWYLPMVSHGGVVMFDDTDWTSTQKAVSMLMDQCDVIKDDPHYKWFKKR